MHNQPTPPQSSSFQGAHGFVSSISSIDHQHASSIVIKRLLAVPATSVMNKFAIRQGMVNLQERMATDLQQTHHLFQEIVMSAEHLCVVHVRVVVDVSERATLDCVSMLNPNGGLFIWQDPFLSNIKTSCHVRRHAASFVVGWGGDACGGTVVVTKLKRCDPGST